MENIKQPESKFLKVECKNCGNQQIVFDKAATTVKCGVCDAPLATPKGGKAQIEGKVIRSFD